MMRKSYLKLRIERQLLPRLQVIGWLLILFSIISFVYGIFRAPLPQAAVNTTLVDEMETAGFAEPGFLQNESQALYIQQEIIDYSAVAFLVIGSACIFFAWRRNVKLKKR